MLGIADVNRQANTEIAKQGRNFVRKNAVAAAVISSFLSLELYEEVSDAARDMTRSTKETIFAYTL